MTPIVVLNRCKYKTDYYVVQSTDSRVADTLLWLDGWVLRSVRCVYGTMMDVCLGTMDEWYGRFDAYIIHTSYQDIHPSLYHNMA